MRVVMAYGGVDGDDEMMMVAVVLVVVVEVAARGGGDRVDRVKRNLFGFGQKSMPEKFSGCGLVVAGGGGWPEEGGCRTWERREGECTNDGVAASFQQSQFHDHMLIFKIE
ncbi:hypothetical protein Tco_0357552 [Tanacetum coccineum]